MPQPKKQANVQGTPLVLSEHCFTQNPRTNTPNYFLKISEEELIISTSIQTLRELQIKDAIGIQTSKEEEGIYRITISSYPRRRSFFSGEKRCIEKLNLWIKTTEDQVSQLKMTLLRKIANRPNLETSEQLIFLAFWNPVAGSNSKAYLTKVTDFIGHTNFTLEIIQTTHKNHCKEHLSKIDPAKYQGIIIISGDGLVHEVANSAVAGKVPVAHVPAGSGNAFSKNQTDLAGEECTAESVLFMAVKGRTRDFNLMKIELEKESAPVYSFLSLTWAIISDMDINSEFLRALGPLRFDLYGGYRCLNIRKYGGRFSFSTESAQLPPLEEPIPQKAPYQVVEQDFKHLMMGCLPFFTTSQKLCPLVDVEERKIDMQYISDEESRWELIKYMLALGSAGHFDMERRCPADGFKFNHDQVKSYRLEPEGPNTGCFSIDGEYYESQKIQATMLDGGFLAFA